MTVKKASPLFLALVIVLLCTGFALAEPETVSLRILATSDLHGKLMPWDYALNEESLSGSMTQLAAAVKACRTENTLLVDAGDTISVTIIV